MLNKERIKVVLGVTGGIAAYKSADVVRRLKERGAEVQVVMTSSAEKLVSASVFQAVSGQPVRGDLWDDQAEAAMGHIELARWADLVLVAPATANIMAELAAGSANNLLTTLCLATEAPLVLAPAMNQAMWRNPATRANLETLLKHGVTVIGPADGEQACGDQGPGRMEEPGTIVDHVFNKHMNPVAGILDGLHVLLTAGPTRESIDPVRFISNRSSGKMGYAMAQAAADAGARVTLISGPVTLPTPRNVERIDVETVAEMHDETLARAKAADLYIGAAAIADYRPEEVHNQKIKKKADSMTLKMVKSPDVLAEVSALKSGPFTVGFAAETENLEKNARAKLAAKKLDMIVANLVGHDLCFDSDDNSVLVLWHGGGEDLPRMLKTDLARQIMALVASHYRQSVSAPTPIRQPTAS